jgi:hypothetical protein
VAGIDRGSLFSAADFFWISFGFGKFFVKNFERINPEWFFVLLIFSKFFQKIFHGPRKFSEKILAGYFDPDSLQLPYPTLPIYPGSISHRRKKPL